MSFKFKRATGAPIRDEDASILGQEFLRIATAHRIKNLRTLTKEIVLDEVIANEKHPLRRFYNWNVDEAARAHWLERTQVLLNSVRIIEANVTPRKPRKMFVTVRDVRNDEGRVVHHGLCVLAPDVARYDEIFVAYLETSINRVEQALRSAEEWAERGTVPERHRQLLDRLRATFSGYLTVLPIQVTA